MGTKGGNVGSDRYSVEKDHFDVFERLSPKLREAIANAPYPFGVIEIAVYWERLMGAGMEKDEAEKLILERFNEMIRRKIKYESRALYGPDHPQAQEVQNEKPKTP